MRPEVLKTRKFDDLQLRYYNALYNQKTKERWTKVCILSYPKKGDLVIAKNYRGITLTSIATKIYNVLLLNCSEPEIEKILRIKMIFGGTDPQHYRFWQSVVS